MRWRRPCALLGCLLLVMPLSGCSPASWIGVRLEGDVLQIAVPACVEQPTRITVDLVRTEYDEDTDEFSHHSKRVWTAEGPLTLPQAQGEYRTITLDDSLSPDTEGNYQGALEALDPFWKNHYLDVRMELDDAEAAAGTVQIESTTVLRRASEGGLFAGNDEEGHRIEDLDLEHTDLCPRGW